ncbi:serine hydrolase domain-containing protein [Novosphingobium sp.]|uniref:serine hydrolase domain-containing protein n=1 Tax=Novosphingobium sp. TaxID=1874826 RepID=UPI0035AF573F
MKRLILALSALSLVAAPLHAQPLQPDEAAAIDAVVTRVMKETGVPSVEIAVVRDGEVVLDRAWGKPSETIATADPTLPYQIASNSKQFLAALLLMLEDEGKLSLDDPVAKWVPGVTDSDKMTVRQLLSHTSGLQDFWPQDYAFKAMETPVDPVGIVSRWGTKPLDYAPGTRWQYSNTGYVVAGMIAEKAGGAPLWQQLEERIFKPLGIHPYKLDDTNGPGFPQGYHRYALGPARVATPPAPGWLWAAGEISMSAAELAEWDIARINRTLLPASDWDEMERPVRLSDGTTNGYGLGVYSRTLGGRKVIDHGGESVGFLSQNTIWPDDKVAIVVLTNADFSGATSTLTGEIASIVLPKGPAANDNEAPRTEDAYKTVSGLLKGVADPALFTENGRYYFTPQVLKDYRTSLAPLGPLKKVDLVRTPRLRGGFVNRVFLLTFAKGKMTLSTYAEPGEHGRWEQFMISQ